MNYRHAYHAGNFADVFKHALLALGLEQLGKKDKPYRVIDTHAGVGLYDLSGTEAGKTGEARDGIDRLLAASGMPAELGGYLEAVRAVRARAGTDAYPGSPLIAQALMRPQDKLHLCELHPEDAAALAGTMRGDRRVKVEERDGYGALKALLPPPERRGLVLIDPPFERRDEFQAMEKALLAAHRRWATGVYALWYPIKDPLSHGAFQARLAGHGLRNTWAVDLYVRAPEDPARLNGCGFVFVNPPYSVLRAADSVMPFLADLLAQGKGARFAAGWIVGEDGA